jgi:hypothetical protein
MTAKIVGSISATIVRRILSSHKPITLATSSMAIPLAPRDEAFVKSIQELALYTLDA